MTPKAKTDELTQKMTFVMKYNLIDQILEEVKKTVEASLSYFTLTKTGETERVPPQPVSLSQVDIIVPSLHEKIDISKIRRANPLGPGQYGWFGTWNIDGLYVAFVVFQNGPNPFETRPYLRESCSLSYPTIDGINYTEFKALPHALIGLRANATEQDLILAISKVVDKRLCSDFIEEDGSFDWMDGASSKPAPGPWPNHLLPNGTELYFSDDFFVCVTSDGQILAPKKTWMEEE